MTSRLIATTVGIALVSIMHAEDNVTAAPKGTYTITQHYAESWDATLRFRDATLGDAPLAADPDRYPWPATYLISPDDEWILRIQKTGSGENSAFLYRVDRSGRVWRMAQCLDDWHSRFLHASTSHSPTITIPASSSLRGIWRSRRSGFALPACP